MNPMPHELPAETPTRPLEEPPFLVRWSRRKLGQDPGRDSLPEEEAPRSAHPLPGAVPSDAPPASVTPEPEEAIDPRTGKRMSELTDADMPDLETLDENSDLAVFMAKKVSNALRMKALTRVFHSAKFNQVCLCAEYADDYTNFTPMGDVVPHDLRQAIAREAGKLVERLAGRGIELTPEEAHARVAAEFRGERVPELPIAQADTEAAPRSSEPTLAAYKPETEPARPPSTPEHREHDRPFESL